MMNNVETVLEGWFAPVFTKDGESIRPKPDSGEKFLAVYLDPDLYDYIITHVRTARKYLNKHRVMPNKFTTTEVDCDGTYTSRGRLFGNSLSFGFHNPYSEGKHFGLVKSAVSADGKMEVEIEQWGNSSYLEIVVNTQSIDFIINVYDIETRSHHTYIGTLHYAR